MSEKRKKSISIAIPASIVSEYKNLRDKTNTIGTIARAASIYRVDNIYIFKDNPDESVLIKNLLNYVETPQYLRKKLYGIKPEYKYVGVLNPLRTPHHPREKYSKNLKPKEYRDGIIVSKNREESYVDIGVERLLKAKGKTSSVGSRVTTQILDKRLMVGRFASRSEISEYWGYKTQIHKGSFSKLSGSFPLRIATSRKGANYTTVLDNIKKDWRIAKRVFIAFGSPRKGLDEILTQKDGSMKTFFDYELNMIPNQGTATVRSEEAIHATLAILNLLDSV